MTENTAGQSAPVDRPCSAALRRRLQDRLATLARKIEEIHVIARLEMPNSYVYFESAGSAHVMSHYTGETGDHIRAIVASSPHCNFDCGAF